MKNLFNPWLDSTIKDTRLSDFYRTHVVDKSPVHATVTDSYLASALPMRRLRLFFATLFLGIIVLMLRNFYLQIVQGQSFVQRADRNRIHIEYLPAARGLFYDNHGTVLVENEPNFVISLNPSELPPSDEPDYMTTLQAVAQSVERDPVVLIQELSEHAQRYPEQSFIVQDFIPHVQALNLLSNLRALPGVHIEPQPSRRYLNPEAFAHVLGYLGKISPNDLELYTQDQYSFSDTVGKSGIEFIYESQLRGQKGQREIEINAQGQAIDAISETPPTPGENIVLGIDAELQTALYDALADVSKDVDSPGGAAVALDPRTGKIRALVSYPSFNSNDFIQGISSETYNQLINDTRKPLFNKAVSGEYPSGSTFKLIVAAAALQEGVVTDSTTVQSTGGIKIDKLYPDWKAGGHGTTDIYKALAESVNTYFYLAGGGSYNSETREITGGLGIDRIHAYAEEFGLGKVTGIDLPAEGTGFVPSRPWKKMAKQEDWYLGDTYIVSIGQGDLLVTPLQVALYTSVVANGGTLYRPQLVERFTSQAGETVRAVEPDIVRQSFIDPSYLGVVREGMYNAVTVGSARRMNTLPVTSAGKTGTAQIGGTERTHSWYTTFLPYDNPELVLTVLVEEGGEGSESALTVAQQVLSEYYSK